MKSTAVVAALVSLVLHASVSDGHVHSAAGDHTGTHAHSEAGDHADTHVPPEAGARDAICAPENNREAPCHMTAFIETTCAELVGKEYQKCMCSQEHSNKTFLGTWTGCRECLFADKPNTLEGWRRAIRDTMSQLCDGEPLELKFQEIFKSHEWKARENGDETASSGGPTASSSAEAGAHDHASSHDHAGSHDAGSAQGDAHDHAGSAKMDSHDYAGPHDHAGSATTGVSTAVWTSVGTSSLSRFGDSTSTALRPTGTLASGASINAAAASILAVAVAGTALMVL